MPTFRQLLSRHDARTRDEMLVQRSAGWFLFVALISLVNSVFYFFDFYVVVLIRLWGGLGLAVTELACLLAQRSGGAAPVLALIFSIVISVLFIVFWKFAVRATRGAFTLARGSTPWMPFGYYSRGVM